MRIGGALEARPRDVSSRRYIGAGVVGDTRLTLRVDFGPGRSVGPGKIRLLEAIDRTGSISQAGRSLGMSYRRAWLLIDDMNQCFRDTVVNARPGGSQGGGAVLTEFGAELVRDYRAIEAAAAVAARVRRDASNVAESPAISARRSGRMTSSRPAAADRGFLRLGGL